ncbi:hypothetical protein [Sulfitobacter aestuariivivens]|uniref:PEP-CTERM sorting domain-containing protein n=1 Tax=Sulfitobacter aestuariivivens TaxID=2766981 RepID=A0A927HF23_9RHOB|nr:hypothetical protein [Sulfitobacter aestuariivivens]MBD3662785.1 hypothetical protein [Sulfitobacter aestuariivivens]
MRLLRTIALALAPTSALACGGPVCLVDPDSLLLPQIIDFEDIASGWGPGIEIDSVLPMPGASFGEHFAGQTVASLDTYDQITGAAFAPLTLMPGADGQNLSVVQFSGNTLINGWGVAGFPRREAQGEGAIAVLFDIDQSALAFDLRGGEAGAALVTFMRRDGGVIGSVPVEPTGEFAVGFIRATGEDDIAGFVITNTDPQGLAIDTLRFGKPPELS